MTFDLIVVGSGMAGLCAAVTGLEAGRRVLLVERESHPGGTTRLSDGIFNCFDPKRQIQSRIEDSPEKHLKDMMAVGRERNHQKLAETVCYEALPTLSWLESLGFEFAPQTYQASGAPYPRCHQPMSGKGEAYVHFLLREAQKRGLVMMTDATVETLIWDSRKQRVTGVGLQTKKGGRQVVKAALGLVLAHGGFQTNNALLKRFSPLLENVKSSGANGCRGELLAQAADLGAQIIHTGYYVWDLKARARSVLMHPERFILVDSKGRRFCREDMQFDAMGERILELKDKSAWIVSPDINTSEPIPFKDEALRATLEAYEEAVTIRRDVKFGKDARFLKSLYGRLGFCRVECTITTTLGGLFINERAEVLDRQGRPIKGLTAAGDAVGGIFGCWSSTGDNLAAAATFGRTASRTLLSLS